MTEDLTTLKLQLLVAVIYMRVVLQQLILMMFNISIAQISMSMHQMSFIILQEMNIAQITIIFQHQIKSSVGF